MRESEAGGGAGSYYEAAEKSGDVRVRQAVMDALQRVTQIAVKRFISGVIAASAEGGETELRDRFGRVVIGGNVICGCGI